MTIRQGQSSFNIDDILNQKDIANKNTFRQYMDWRVIWAVLSLNENENLTYEGAGWTIESLYRLEAASWSYSLPHYTHIIFRDFEIKKLQVAKASNFPGYVISNSIAGFIIVTSIVTMIFTILSYPVFWDMIWFYRSYVVAILVSTFLK